MHFGGSGKAFRWFLRRDSRSTLLLRSHGTVSAAALPQNKRTRRSRQRGASILEAAVIFVPFLAIFFAIFDFGMALFLKNTMQFAVRQGVRYAVTSQTSTDSNGNALGQDASIKQAV